MIEALSTDERLDMYSVRCPHCQQVTQMDDVHICAPAVSRETRVKVTEEMITRFLQWKLPDDFRPDAGISFNPEYSIAYKTWPTGTNLFHAEQAKAMLEHVLGDAPNGD